MIGNIGNPDVVELQSGHSVMFSHPHELAEVVNRVAARVLPMSNNQ
jgi:hypothetical protein